MTDKTLALRARIAVGTSWDGKDGGHGNETPSQEPVSACDDFIDTTCEVCGRRIIVKETDDPYLVLCPCGGGSTCAAYASLAHADSSAPAPAPAPAPADPEILTGWGGSDPDDLAVCLCAALHAAGKPAHVEFRCEEGKAVAIQVFSDDRLMGEFPCQPIATAHMDALAGGIERAGRLLSQQLHK
jgi:hypothetical protein